MELDSDSVVTQEHIYTAIKFGVDLSKIGDPVEMKKYLLAFIHALLLQREKINLEQLTDSFGSSIVTTWQAVLSIMESSSRKLFDADSGSLTFKLFCPNVSSAQELQDDTWLKTLAQKMELLMHKIGE